MEKEHAWSDFIIPVESNANAKEIDSQNNIEIYDEIDRYFHEWSATGQPYRLSEDIIQQINGIAVKGLRSDAGQYRCYRVEISNTNHQPPSWREVGDLMKAMCDHVGDQVHERPLYYAAFLLWRLNWIHPFGDGNGRTSRALCYLMICIGFEAFITGSDAIPAQIEKNKAPYYEALDAADEACKNGTTDISQLEDLLNRMLRVQLGLP